jgi:acetate kinase
MADAIIVVNAGSSSIKFSVFLIRNGDLESGIRGQIEGIYTMPRFVAKRSDGTVLSEKSWPEGEHLGHETALDHLVGFLHSEFKDAHLIGVGHRVVHGFTRPVRVNPDIVAALEKLIPLAPLHQPHNIAPVRRLLERSPELLQVACFDTSFHRTNPELAQRFALPEDLYAEGLRRYGFHGLSYEYVASVLEQFDSRAAVGKCVVMHLGNGASMAAIESGRSVASTMGFTAVEGLPMGTRSGSIDPGVILYLLNHRGMDARGIEKLLYHQSGLLGVSGISSDMRTLLASSEPRAKLAVDLYCYRIRRELGSLSAAMGGLDAIVFTGGIGENSAEIRNRVCRDAHWLGVELDSAANAAGGPRISSPDAEVAAWVIPTNEELMIARHTYRLLQTV